MITEFTGIVLISFTFSICPADVKLHPLYKNTRIETGQVVKALDKNGGTYECVWSPENEKRKNTS